MPKVKNILVPVDFTDFSNHALDYAMMVAKKFNSRITLFHVVEQFTYSFTDSLQMVDHYASLLEIAGSMLNEMTKKVKKRGVKVKQIIVKGYPSLEIIKKSAEESADLIVMGTHGRTGLQHLVLGSVAERVVRMAECPVLTVAPKKKKKK